MYGIKTSHGWIKPTEGETKYFFSRVNQPTYPFRSEAGAAQIAADWKITNYEIRKQPSSP